jgi:hypothetical protein
VKWKGCVWLKKGAPVDVVHSGEEGTEIIVQGKLGSRTIRCFKRERGKKPETGRQPRKIARVKRN